MMSDLLSASLEMAFPTIRDTTAKVPESGGGCVWFKPNLTDQYTIVYTYTQTYSSKEIMQILYAVNQQSTVNP